MQFLNKTQAICLTIKPTNAFNMSFTCASNPECLSTELRLQISG